MTSTEFIHVTEFFQTIFCFSILVLIGQRFVMTWRKLDDTYLQLQSNELNSQLNWQLKKDSSKSKHIQQNQTQIKDQNVQQNLSKQKQHSQPPKQSNLRTSLVENETDQTDRKMSEMNEEFEISNSKQYKRKSLTDLRKSQDKNLQQIKDYSQSSTSRKKSVDIEKPAEKLQKSSQNNINRMDSEGFEKNAHGAHMMQPSITSNPDPVKSIQVDVKTNIKLELFRQTDAIFNQHLPVLMSILILGILVHSTYIFMMVCFFGYLISHILLNYACKTDQPQMSERIQPQSFKSKYGRIVPKFWILGIFVSYWVDKQFS